MLQHALVGADGDAARSPLGADPAVSVGVVALLLVVIEAVAAAQRRGALLVVGSVAVDVPGELLAAKDAAQEPAAREVVGVDDAAVAQLDALPRPVHPGEVEVEGGLDDAEDDRDRVRLLVVGVELLEDPVEQVEAAVGAEEDDVEGGDDGGDGGLAEEEELREDADGFEDLGKDPEVLLVERRLAKGRGKGGN